MGQKAVLAFLTHWRNRQEGRKTWPLKFIPQRKPIRGDQEEGESHEAKEGVTSGGGLQEKANESEREEEEGGMSKEAESASESGGRHLNKEKGVEDTAATPNKVDPSLRKSFLRSLSDQGDYRKLIELLDVADVSHHYT
jgi:hypothetical protein